MTGAAGGAGPFTAALRRDADPIWAAMLDHPFVRGIGDGTLPADRFRFFVRQDYLFLVDYGRLLALGAARAPRLDWMRRFAELTQAVLVTEMDLHRGYAAGWGIGAAELEREPAHPVTRAYTDFLLRTAALGDFAELVAALLPCMWGYSEVGRHLAATATTGEARYREWIDTYADEDFTRLAGWCREICDAVAAGADHPVRSRMRAAFIASSEHELAFWQSAWESAGGS